MEQDVIYCESCQVVEVGLNEKYCADCLEDIVADMVALWVDEQTASEGGLY